MVLGAAALTILAMDIGAFLTAAFLGLGLAAAVVFLAVFGIKNSATFADQQTSSVLTDR
jgi:hypothetical protein